MRFLRAIGEISSSLSCVETPSSLKKLAKDPSALLSKEPAISRRTDQTFSEIRSKSSSVAISALITSERPSSNKYMSAIDSNGK